MKMNKKGVVDQLQPLVVALVAVGIVLVIGFLIMAEATDQLDSKGEICSDNNWFNDTDDTCYISSTNGTANGTTTHAYNGTRETVDAMNDIPGWLGIIVITLIGALLIGLVALFKRRV